MRFLFATIALTAAALAAATACPPAASFSYGQQSYSTCAQASTYVAPQAAITYYAYPITLQAVPTVAVPVQQVQPMPQVAPQAVPQAAPQQQEAAVPQAAPIVVQVPQATAIVRQQVYSTYAVPQAIVQHSYAYGVQAQANVILHRQHSYAPAAAVILDRGRAVVQRRAPVIVQRQRRFAPIRNAIARRQAARAGGGVPAAQVIIRR